MSYDACAPCSQRPQSVATAVVEQPWGGIIRAPLGTPCPPSYRSFTFLQSRAVVTVGIVSALQPSPLDFPGSCAASWPHTHLLAQTERSLSGGYLSARTSLQVDRLDASESLRKQEEHVAEPAPLLFGRWHPTAPSEGSPSLAGLQIREGMGWVGGDRRATMAAGYGEGQYLRMLRCGHCPPFSEGSCLL